MTVEGLSSRRAEMPAQGDPMHTLNDWLTKALFSPIAKRPHADLELRVSGG